MLPKVPKRCVCRCSLLQEAILSPKYNYSKHPLQKGALLIAWEAPFSIPPVVTWWWQSLHKLSNVNYASNVWLVADNYYGTPKPPAEPSPLLLNVAEQLLPGATPRSQGKRRRNKSVSNMEKAGIEPPEEEEEERPIINGNGVAITPGEELSISLRIEILSCALLQCSKSSYCCDLRSGLLA